MDELVFFFDLETVPIEMTKEDIIEFGKGRAPSNYRDPDKIKNYELKKAEEIYRSFSLDPMKCHVLVCCYAVGSVTWADGVKSIELGEIKTLRSDKHDIVSELDRIVGGLTEGLKRRPKVTLVAHNIKKFDAPVLMAQAVKCGAPHLVDMMNFDKPWESCLFDTNEWWRVHCCTTRSTSKLDVIGRFLGLGSKTEGMDGSKVLDVYQKHGIDPIAEYCKQDVELLQAVYQHLLEAKAI